MSFRSLFKNASSKNIRYVHVTPLMHRLKTPIRSIEQYVVKSPGGNVRQILKKHPNYHHNALGKIMKTNSSGGGGGGTPSQIEQFSRCYNKHPLSFTASSCCAVVGSFYGLVSCYKNTQPQPQPPPQSPSTTTTTTTSTTELLWEKATEKLQQLQLQLPLPRIFGFNSVHAITPNLSHHNFIADVVSKTEPAVVFIEMKGQHPESGKRITESTGSGFLVRPNGLILTAAHVVPRRSKVIVKLQNGDVYEGKVTAVDPIHDLATIKIEPKGKQLPCIQLERSSTIRPGEFVIAMGSPLSLSNTATFGIVSSSRLRGSKELGLENKDMQYIQTDAVISFGNSGGPLVNLDEKAIGINNLKITSGISMAIPADYAFDFLEKVDRVAEKAAEAAAKNSNKTPSNKFPNNNNKRRFMGITMLPLTPHIVNNLREKFQDLPPLDNGVYVLKVNVGSPAYDGGIHAGDIIVEVNGRRINSTQDVYDCVEKDRRLRAVVVRGTHTREIEILTEELF